MTIITYMFYYNNPNNALHFYSFKCKPHFSTFKPSLPTLHHNSIAVLRYYLTNSQWFSIIIDNPPQMLWKINWWKSLKITSSLSQHFAGGGVCLSAAPSGLFRLPQDCSDPEQCRFSQLGFGCSRGQRSRQGLCKAGLHQCVFFFICALLQTLSSVVSLSFSHPTVLVYRTELKPPTSAWPAPWTLTSTAPPIF